ncbi:MAG: LacI family DNA-binding transcriptional regulator [Arcanobacterium sp.]|nr:LacI family DNA-binding transcriptional regulator [Arcanobacterium sp.]
MAKKIRLADIAKQAGVSTATVSRVLNDKGLVASETRYAVLAALDTLGYERPERLRERQDGLIGLILPELTNPIFPSFVQHLQVAMSMKGYTPLLGTQYVGATPEDVYVAMMLDQHVSGIIFVSGIHADLNANISHYHEISKRKIPFVTINGKNPDISAPDFSSDDRFAVAVAVRHLLSQGHTKIGLATGSQRFVPAHEKAESFHSVMRKLLPNSPIYQSNTLFTVEGGQAAAHQLISQGCTAIICGSDVMALGAIRYCHSAGLRVPQDISIIGYDDSPLIAFTDPPLTTLHQPVKTICDAAVSTLISMINHDNSSVSSMRFTPELIVRESTGAVRSHH